MTFRIHHFLTLSLGCVLQGGPAVAQSSTRPIYVGPPVAIQQPVDHAFDGVIELNVDATDVGHRIFNVHERIPLKQGGAMTLLYSRWEAASHGPSLTVTNLAGLIVEAEGRRLTWQRDRYEPHAFHLDVPAAAGFIDVRFQVIADGDLLSPDIVAIPWQRLTLYPAGWYTRNIAVAATLTLPTELRAFSALKVEAAQGSTIRYGKTTLEILLDTPVLAGRYTAQMQLTGTEPGAVSLDLVAPRSSDLVVPSQRIDELRKLITQMRAVFGSTPFGRYQILARLSVDGSSGGTEHRTS